MSLIVLPMQTSSTIDDVDYDWKVQPHVAVDIALNHAVATTHFNAFHATVDSIATTHFNTPYTIK
jgi:hypothetical protein